MYPSKSVWIILDAYGESNMEKPVIKTVLIEDAWEEYQTYANAEDLARDWEASFGDPSYYGYDEDTLTEE
jgi:hypothetical protein